MAAVRGTRELPPDRIKYTPADISGPRRDQGLNGFPIRRTSERTNMEWEEQQFTILEDAGNEYGRVRMMIHSIPKVPDYHVLTDVFITSSLRARRLWHEAIQKGAPLFVLEMALSAMGTMAERRCSK